jgi:hypothetical protein
MYFVRMCRDAHLSPLPSGGWKDCSDGHALSICWNRACFHSFSSASCPCPAWFVVDAVIPFFQRLLKLILLLCAPPLPRLHAYPAGRTRTPLRPGAQPAVINQGQGACFAVHRALHAHTPLLVRRARLPTSDDNLCRHTSSFIHILLRDTCTRGRLSSCYYSADLELPPLARRACATPPLCR